MSFYCFDYITINLGHDVFSCNIVLFGRKGMHMMSKLQTTTNKISRKLPANRPPTHPGEMLLEEFIKPLNITQTELGKRLGVSYPLKSWKFRGQIPGRALIRPVSSALFIFETPCRTRLLRVPKALHPQCSLIKPCIRFSRTRVSDVLHLVDEATYRFTFVTACIFAHKKLTTPGYPDAASRC